MDNPNESINGSIKIYDDDENNENSNIIEIKKKLKILFCL